jgi:isopenicillin N synthase-like dioxygenase
MDAPPVRGSFICNIGDMLDRMTGGLYRSTPHRVINTSGRHRLSFPFFFDPNFDVEVKPILAPAADDKDQRWDQASVHAFTGTYGDYVLSKVGKVFPGLFQSVLTTSSQR